MPAQTKANKKDDPEDKNRNRDFKMGDDEKINNEKPFVLDKDEKEKIPSKREVAEKAERERQERVKELVEEMKMGADNLKTAAREVAEAERKKKVIGGKILKFFSPKQQVEELQREVDLAKEKEHDAKIELHRRMGRVVAEARIGSIDRRDVRVEVDNREVFLINYWYKTNREVDEIKGMQGFNKRCLTCGKMWIDYGREKLRAAKDIVKEDVAGGWNLAKNAARAVVGRRAVDPREEISSRGDRPGENTEAITEGETEGETEEAVEQLPEETVVVEKSSVEDGDDEPAAINDVTSIEEEMRKKERDEITTIDPEYIGEGYLDEKGDTSEEESNTGDQLESEEEKLVSADDMDRATDKLNELNQPTVEDGLDTEARKKKIKKLEEKIGAIAARIESLESGEHAEVHLEKKKPLLGQLRGLGNRETREVLSSLGKGLARKVKEKFPGLKPEQGKAVVLNLLGKIKSNDTIRVKRTQRGILVEVNFSRDGDDRMSDAMGEAMSSNEKMEADDYESTEAKREKNKI